MSDPAAAETAPAEDEAPAGGPFSGRTAWARRMETPLRMFLATETGSASVLAGATVAALIWANISISSYDMVWATRLAVLVGRWGVTLDLREFVNSGLMVFFFLVVGLEARREFDLGELRVRSRLTLPLLVGLGGMIVPIGIYLIVNAGRPSQHGWGMAMSTDTAFALGALALVGRRLPDRVRTYLLTFSIVDDLAGHRGHRDRVQRAHRRGAAAVRDRAPGRGPDHPGARCPVRAVLTWWSGSRPGWRS